ncbi:putative membrane protein [Deinobacterium chartae]|uniref:Putative membrane protein n=1 Tax=Deinobacterium chartae TaxID=521158 RepID=A0A841HZM3_9DEIO|nr:hypothetical protein [Deinobacterium chartae]MBB6097650.1 putative membrane protein [Deinobacterium chartae]
MFTAALWILVALLLLSASGILYAAFGPLKQTSSATTLRVVGIIQLLMALGTVLIVLLR